MKVYIEVNIDDYSSWVEEEDITTRIVHRNDIIDGAEDYILESKGFIKITPKTKDLSYQAKEILADNGWIHKDTVKDKADKKLFDEQFFIVDLQDTWGTVQEIDVNNLRSSEIQDLASYKKHIVQKVSNKSVLSESQYKKLTTEKEKIKKKKEAAKKAAETRAANKKQKEIEKAEKLLKEAGKL